MAGAHFWGTKISAGKFRDVEVPPGAMLRVNNIVASPGSSGVLTLFVRTEDINDEACLCALGVLRPGGGCDNVQISTIFCEDIPLRFSVKASEGGSGAVYVSGYFEEVMDNDDAEGYGSGGEYGEDDEDDDDYMNGDDDEDDEDELGDEDDEDDEGGLYPSMPNGDDDDFDDEDDDDDDEPGADESKPGMTGKKRGASFDIDRDQVDDDDDEGDDDDDDDAGAAPAPKAQASGKSKKGKGKKGKKKGKK